MDTASRQDIADVNRALRGEGDAYRRLVERHQDAIAAMMWRFSRDPETHEQLVQDVFVEAYTSLRTYAARAPFAHWLSRIATRVGYRFWKEQTRERKRIAVSQTDWERIPAPASEEAPDPAVAAETVHRLLERLSPRDRLVVTLRYLEDRSVEETARMTGMSQTMVKVQTWRARNRLRKMLDAAEGGENDA